MTLDTRHRSSAVSPVPPTGSDGRAATARAATARELAAAVGHLEVATLQEHHLALLLAVADLAHAAGTDWPWGPDDPTVALLRAVAKLSLVAPDAASGHAGALVADLEALARPLPA